jgi:hypothetical protein
MVKLHLVFGGELKNPEGTEFRDVKNIDIVGIFPNYEEAMIAWRAASQKSVDSALIRYFVADLTKLRDTKD